MEGVERGHVHARLARVVPEVGQPPQQPLHLGLHQPQGRLVGGRGPGHRTDVRPHGVLRGAHQSGGGGGVGGRRAQQTEQALALHGTRRVEAHAPLWAGPGQLRAQHGDRGGEVLPAALQGGHAQLREALFGRVERGDRLGQPHEVGRRPGRPPGLRDGVRHLAQRAGVDAGDRRGGALGRGDGGAPPLGVLPGRLQRPHGAVRLALAPPPLALLALAGLALAPGPAVASEAVLGRSAHPSPSVDGPSTAGGVRPSAASNATRKSGVRGTPAQRTVGPGPRSICRPAPVSGSASRPRWRSVR